MIVCLCNGHNDRDIRAKAAEIGSDCPVAVYGALAGPPRCGRCLDYAGMMLRSAPPRRDDPCRTDACPNARTEPAMAGTEGFPGHAALA